MTAAEKITLRRSAVSTEAIALGARRRRRRGCGNWARRPIWAVRRLPAAFCNWCWLAWCGRAAWRRGRLPWCPESYATGSTLSL